MKYKKNLILMTLISILLISCLLVGCENANISYSYDTTPREQPKLQTQDVDCIVLDCDYRHWYASAHHYKCYIKVYNEEYDIEQSFTLDGDNAKECEGIQKGDIISCELYSYIMESTGEVTKRFINHIK